MNFRCPDCQARFAGDGLDGLAVVHCPLCGRGFAPHELAGGDASSAAWHAPGAMSGLAVLALVTGILSLVAPLCLCPAVWLAAAAPMAVPPPAMVAPARTVPGTVPPAPTPGAADDGDPFEEELREEDAERDPRGRSDDDGGR